MKSSPLDPDTSRRPTPPFRLILTTRGAGRATCTGNRSLFGLPLLVPRPGEGWPTLEILLDEDDLEVPSTPRTPLDASAAGPWEELAPPEAKRRNDVRRQQMGDDRQDVRSRIVPHGRYVCRRNQDLAVALSLENLQQSGGFSQN